MVGGYIYEREGWPRFRYSLEALAEPLAATRYRQGLLGGQAQAIGSSRLQDAVLDVLTQEARLAAEAGGEYLPDSQDVRSCIGHRLGIETDDKTRWYRWIEGAVDLILDANQNHAAELTRDRICRWYSALFARSTRIKTGIWRDDSAGRKQISSWKLGGQSVRFEAPAASRIATEMEAFLTWFNGPALRDPVLKAALSHLWFVTIHPFDDGNGRIARAIADMALAGPHSRPLSEGERGVPVLRLYSMTAQIRKDRTAYWDILESTQKGDMDVTPWIIWFLGCLDRAMDPAQGAIDGALVKARFWDRIPEGAVNERQRLVLNKLIDGLEGDLTNKRWAAIAGCSADRALRDIQDLILKGMLRRNESGGRSTSYSLTVAGEPVVVGGQML